MKKLIIWKFNRRDGHIIKETIFGYINTIVHPVFTDLRALIYPNNTKKVCAAWLTRFSARSLAYWFMDDGCAAYGKSKDYYAIQFATYSYSYLEHVLIRDFLLSQFGVETIITPYKRKKWFLRANNKASMKFRDLVAPYIVDSMLYKIDKNVWLSRRNNAGT